LNPGVKVLVADDSSSEQTQGALAEASQKYGFSLSISETPLGHWPGDALSLRKTIAFAEECNSAIAIRCNQRTIQLKPNWASQIAGTMLSDDSAVAYQCIWGNPMKSAPSCWHFLFIDGDVRNISFTAETCRLATVRAGCLSIGFMTCHGRSSPGLTLRSIGSREIAGPKPNGRCPITEVAVPVRLQPPLTP
jgi:hypothetical protein